MTKGKKWTLRLLGVAALALLICLCLLGSTMARYTSSGVGNGTLTVAIWDLETVTADIKGESISPAMEAYGEGSGTDGIRENTSSWTQVCKMVNNSAVKASVTLGIPEDENGNAYISMKWDEDFIWGTGWDETKTDYKLEDGTYTGKGQTNPYAQDIMAMFGYNDTEAKNNLATFETLVNTAGVFSLRLAYEVDATTAAQSTDNYDETITVDDGTVYLAYLTGSSTEFTLDAETDAVDGSNEKTIYAEVVWTSIDESSGAIMPTGFTENDAYAAYGSSAWAVFSDAVDTILGMYVTGLSFDLTWTAYQASTLPPVE